MNKKVINFDELTPGSYIKKRLIKGMEMLCVDVINKDSASVRIWKNNIPVKRSFTLKRKDVDKGDYVFVLQVNQQNLVK